MPSPSADPSAPAPVSPQIVTTRLAAPAGGSRFAQAWLRLSGDLAAIAQAHEGVGGKRPEWAAPMGRTDCLERVTTP